MENTEKHLIPRENQRGFMLAGRSRFTIYNPKTENKFSFKVMKRKKKKGEENLKDMYFVSVDTNLDNRKDIESHRQYNYLGVIIDNKYSHGRKSRLSAYSKYNVVFDWLFNKVMTNTTPAEMEFYHNNHCCCCGKTLRIPESIKTGIGPECSKHYKLYD